MRLIDADKFLDLIDTENQRCITSTGHDLTIGIVRSFIKREPTAYDVDKVVEQSNKLQIYKPKLDDIMEYMQRTGDKTCLLVNLQDVLKIIKAGGINENR